MDIQLAILLSVTAVLVIILVALLVVLGKKKKRPYRSMDRDIEKIKEQII